MKERSISVRHAFLSDRAQIVRFMNENWGSRHPLVNLPDFFEHYYIHDGKLQFVLAQDGGRVVAVAGYILANSYSPADAWVSIWCACKGYNGIGLELMDALPRLANIRVLACNNIRPETMTFYRFLGWYADRIPHYYRLADQQNYTVARNTQNAKRLPVKGDLSLFPVYSTVALEGLGMPDSPCLPAKDLWYIRRRYFAYPRQHYNVWASSEGGRLAAYLITRTVEVEGTGVKVLRIVDFIGRPVLLPRLGGAIDRIMQAAGAEYAECYCAGIDAALFAQAGFSERREGDEIVVPNYLTPPVYQNTEYYYFTSHPDNFVLFKADGDQDRPNLG